LVFPYYIEDFIKSRAFFGVSERMPAGRGHRVWRVRRNSGSESCLARVPPGTAFKLDNERFIDYYIYLDFGEFVNLKNSHPRKDNMPITYYYEVYDTD
jgi:hypothetical protein